MLDAMAQEDRYPDLSKYPKFSREQLGHIRHFHNLASQQDGEWNHMGSQEPLQEFLDAYRYQLATMYYAAGAAHFHHQPLLRSVYKDLLQKIIDKMLLRAVWSYWFNASLGGIMTNPDLKELRKPWADPVQRENIMYSGHLLMMIALHSMLFDDDTYEKDGSLHFVWNPTFFGMGEERFEYNAQSLQDAILAEMEKNDWTGVCCEPNLVFVVCNQFPLIGIRLRDVKQGTNKIDEVLEKYEAAWRRKGIDFRSGELLPDAFMVQQDRMRLPKDVAWTAWGAAFMNAWNSETIAATYDEQSLGFITNTGGQVRINQPAVGVEFRRLVKEEGASPSDESTLRKAQEKAQHDMMTETAKKKHFPYTKPTFGYVVQWLGELGKPELAPLLEYADAMLHPTWQDGGLYYPRNDKPFDNELNWTHMDPFTGNAAIGYARLNIHNGMKTMWDRPWTSAELEKRPYVDGVTLSEDVDFVRGVWDEEALLLLLTVKTWDGRSKLIHPVFKNLSAGRWQVWIGEKSQETQDIPAGGEIAVSALVSGSDLDIVLSHL